MDGYDGELWTLPFPDFLNMEMMSLINFFILDGLLFVRRNLPLQL